ncbi:polyglutamine-binding protein 1 [Dorcoceras hygrometricum]|uniref:Polyglutamine-binding protein 1 n=1 Tax=Dorcoceras hygrometricum TaxID=472368 RepID=A0A2Z7BZZ6_9LAMI|nr:polyglutamine-binding protein 1 [Dorcoceras hygrometricum]
MVSISSGLKVNRAKVLFQVLLAMVKNPTRQSQGFVVQVSVLLEQLVKVDLGESVKLHLQKVLTNKSVHTYIKKNQDVKPTGESSKQTEDTSSETEGGQSKLTKPLEMQVVTQGENKKKKAASEKKKVLITRNHRTKRTKKGQHTNDDHGESQPDPILTRDDKESAAGVQGESISGPTTNTAEIEERVDCETQAKDERLNDNVFTFALGERVESIVQHSTVVVNQEASVDIGNLSALPPTQKQMTYTGQSVYVPIEIREINLVTHFLPKLIQLIKMLEMFMRTVVVEHWKNFHREKPSANQDLMAIHRVASLEIPPGITWQEYRVQYAQRINPTPDQQTNQNPTVEGQLEVVDPSVEQVEDTGKEDSGTISDRQVLEQPAPKKEDQPQFSQDHSSSESSSFNISIQSDIMRYYADPKPSFSESHTLSGSLSVHGADFAHESGSQSSYRTSTSMPSTKRWTQSTNVTSSQTALETNLVRQLDAQQYQLTNDLDFVKLQLVESVNHLKEIGDARKRVYIEEKSGCERGYESDNTSLNTQANQIFTSTSRVHLEPARYK